MLRIPYCTIIYIALILIINVFFIKFPHIIIGGALLSPAELLVGAIYIMRDFTQREIGHYVFLAMLIGALLSFFLASRTIAFASVIAFIAGELLDWAIYTFTRKPLSKRLLWSSTISSPIDSAIFLYLINQLSWLGLTLMSISKILGVLVVWYIWRRRSEKVSNTSLDICA